MPSNNVILAAAGSHKTESIVRAVINADSKTRILVTTYTIENLRQITERLTSANGTIPPNVTVLSWFSFLLREGIKPYQNYLTSTNRIRTVNFQNRPGMYARQVDTDEYYVTPSSDVYSDNAAEFVTKLNSISDGKVIARLEELYDEIYIDEVQDLVGYDLELLDLLFASSLSTVLVGDPRQCTYTTSRTRKNKAYQKLSLFDWFRQRENRGVVTIDWRCISYRCNQTICDFADGLYPDLPATLSKNTATSGHDGIFTISPNEVDAYMRAHQPAVLRYSKSTSTAGYMAINFGACKGLTYDHVLIYPTTNIKKYLQTENVSDVGDLAKFYVAITRARFSVAFVI